MTRTKTAASSGAAARESFVLAIVLFFLVLGVSGGLVVSRGGLFAIGGGGRSLRGLLVFAFLGGGFGQKRVTIRLGDLVVVRVDFAEGEEAVPVAAILYKGGLERGFDPGNLGEIDISPELALFPGFEVEIFNLAVGDDSNPGFLRVRGVDKH